MAVDTHESPEWGPECGAATSPVSKTPDLQKRRVNCPDEFQQVLFIECGHGADQHGQNATKAAVRACRNAIEFNSIPCIQQIVPNGYAGMQIHVKIGVPSPETVDKAAVKAVFPYGRVCCVDVVDGGLRANSGIAVAALGAPHNSPEC